MYNRTVLVMLFLCILVACSGGGSSSSNPASISEPTTLDASLCKFDCEFVECRAYMNPEGKALTIDAHWRERLDLCCAFNLCSIEGECYYGCPNEFVQPRCN